MKMLMAGLLKVFHLLPDGMKLFIRSYKKHEPELNELRWLVERSTLAVDVGANKGAYTYALSKLVGKGGHVIAIEPIAELSRYLRIACTQLSLPVTVEQCCLSSVNGEGELFIPTSELGEFLTGLASLNKLDKSSDGEIIKVNLKRLDDMLKYRKLRISFIKCDVEGHELEVFRGAIDILKTDRPNLLIEIEQRHSDITIKEHFDFFLAQNYKGFFLDESNDIKSLDAFDVATYQSNSSIESCGSKKYVYNFIFLPNEKSDANVLRNKK
jgi:FkbM family methyltransferase